MKRKSAPTNILALLSLLCLVPLLLVLDLLEPEELLPVTLVELRDDIRDGVFNLGDDDMLNGVHTAICQLDHLVQNKEGRLKGGKQGRF